MSSKMSYNEILKIVSETKPGDVWVNSVGGRKATVIHVENRSPSRYLSLRHETGRETKIQGHYLATNYEPYIGQGK